MKRNYKKNYKDIKKKIIKAAIILGFAFFLTLSVLLTKLYCNITKDLKNAQRIEKSYLEKSCISLLSLNDNIDMRLNSNKNIYYSLKNKYHEVYPVIHKQYQVSETMYNIDLPLELTNQYTGLYFSYTNNIITLYLIDNNNTCLEYNIKYNLDLKVLIKILKLTIVDSYKLNNVDMLLIDDIHNIYKVKFVEENVNSIELKYKVENVYHDKILNTSEIKKKITTDLYELYILYNKYENTNYLAFISNIDTSQFIINLNIKNELNIKKAAI